VLTGEPPDPTRIPHGCRFHPRCPKAAPACVDQIPVLEPQLGDTDNHKAACLFPVADGEDLTQAKPTIAAEQRVIESGLLGGS